jgi:hypothetical protein
MDIYDIELTEHRNNGMIVIPFDIDIRHDLIRDYDMNDESIAKHGIVMHWHDIVTPSIDALKNLRDEYPIDSRVYAMLELYIKRELSK